MSDVPLPLLKDKILVRTASNKPMWVYSIPKVENALRKLSKIYLQLINDAYNRKCENHQEEMFYKGFYEGLISANKIKDEVFGVLDSKDEVKGSDSK